LLLYVKKGKKGVGPSRVGNRRKKKNMSIECGGLLLRVIKIFWKSRP
jgi:hypothetical protein